MKADNDLDAQLARHAGRISEILSRQAAELAASRAIDPADRCQGLELLRRALQAAEQLSQPTSRPRCADAEADIQRRTSAP